MTMQNATPPGPAAYRIQQLGPPRDRDGSPVRVHGQGTQLNEPVTGFDSLVLHHPGDSRGVRMVDGSIVGGERDACSPMSAVGSRRSSSHGRSGAGSAITGSQRTRY